MYTKRWDSVNFFLNLKITLKDNSQLGWQQSKATMWPKFDVSKIRLYDLYIVGIARLFVASFQNSQIRGFPVISVSSLHLPQCRLTLNLRGI